MRELFRTLPLVLLVLAVPIVPFVLLGGTIDAWFQQWTERPQHPGWSAALVVGLLATDVFLPVPSSMISTFGGGQLGWFGGTLASWLGLSAGAIAGFALARWLGPAFTQRFARQQSLDQMQALSNRFGPGVIILTRGVPILAEASVLLLGLQRLEWRRFLPPLLLSNLGLSLVYAVFGDFAARYDSTPLALAVSILLPVIVTAVVQRRLARRPAA